MMVTIHCLSELDYEVLDVITENHTDVPPFKVWTKSFEDPIKGYEVTMIDELGQRLENLDVTVEDKSIMIKNPARYNLGETYHMVLTVSLNHGKIIQYQITFTIKDAHSSVGGMDPVLEKVIRDILDKPIGSTITVSDMQSLTDFSHKWSESLREEKITSLAGMEYATHLEHFYLQFHAITDISPLMGLDKLETIWIEGNEIESLAPFSGTSLPNLTSLNMDGNKIRDLSPIVEADLPNLGYYQFNHNQIESICPLVPLYQEVMEEHENDNFNRTLHIFLNHNQISDISCLDQLDLGRKLELQYNQITNLEGLTHLKISEILDLSYNKITNPHEAKNIHIEHGGKIDVSNNSNPYDQ